MTQLTWGIPGEHFYEIGVDRGVLYPLSGPGVAWNGIVSVDEDPSDAEVKSYYIDGVMYLQVPTVEEYAATLTAVYRPQEFLECEGIATGINGLRITRQRRKAFGLSYRTLLGNDVKDNEYGYKLHLVYDILAMPSRRGYNTLGDASNPALFAWELKAKPTLVDAYARSAHLIFDSTVADPEILAALEDILYGTEETDPRLPLPEEIAELGFGIIVTDHGDGSFTITGPDEFVYLTDATSFEVTSPSASFIDSESYTISSV